MEKRDINVVFEFFLDYEVLCFLFKLVGKAYKSVFES